MERVLSRVVLVLSLVSMIALLYASCAGNPKQDSNSSPPPKPPAAPALFWPQAISISQINLSWVWYGDSKQLEGFKIERSLGNENNYSEIATTTKDVTDFNDVELESGTTYYYRILAYNKYGNSDYSDSYWATTFFDGYGMCVNKSSDFPCLQTRCGKIIDGAEYLTVTGAEVFDCLGLQLTAPATMTISFVYKASAGSCYNQPYLEVMAGVQSESFSFDCNASGNSSISIVITNGQTMGDISFVLHSGDWGSSVCIESITFAP